MTDRHYEEHFTRNTESLRCWCYHCNDMTEHAVSDGNIGRCANDHTKKKDPRKASIPQDEIAYCGAAPSAASKEAETLRRHLAALDGMGNRGESRKP